MDRGRGYPIQKEGCECFCIMMEYQQWRLQGSSFLVRSYVFYAQSFLDLDVSLFFTFTFASALQYFGFFNSFPLPFFLVAVRLTRPIIITIVIFGASEWLRINIFFFFENEGQNENEKWRGREGRSSEKLRQNG
jgi:hypothetical protein